MYKKETNLYNYQYKKISLPSLKGPFDKLQCIIQGLNQSSEFFRFTLIHYLFKMIKII